MVVLEQYHTKKAYSTLISQKYHYVLFSDCVMIVFKNKIRCNSLQDSNDNKKLFWYLNLYIERNIQKRE